MSNLKQEALALLEEVRDKLDGEPVLTPDEESLLERIVDCLVKAK